MIDFENPASFLLLIFVPLLYFLRSTRLFSRISFPLTLSDWNGENFKWNQNPRKILSAFSRIILVAAYVLLVASYAEPVKHKQVKVYSSKGASIIFVLDVSPSMASKDIGNQRRIDAAKSAIAKMAEASSGSELGIVEMAASSALIIPPTMDRNLFYSRLEQIKIGELGDGTAIGNGLSSAVYHFEKSTAPKKAIVLITDGENNAGTVHPHTAARLAQQKNISLYVLGLGTKGVVPLEYVDPKTGRVYSGYLESDYDSSALSKIAIEGAGKYYETDSVASLSQAISSISRNENVVQSYHIKNQDTECYGTFLLAATVLVILSWILRRIFLKEVL